MRASEAEAQDAAYRSRRAAARAAPDDILDVVVDLGEEHVLHIPKKSLRSSKALRAAIAKATVKSLGQHAPPSWVAASRGSDGDDLASSMTVTLQFDNQLDEPVSARLTDKTSGQRIREATSVLVLAT